MHEAETTSESQWPHVARRDARYSADNPIRVLLVEDYPVVRLGLRMVIDAQRDMRVVAEAESGSEAVKLAQETSPDLAIIAMRLQGELRGVEICRELKEVPRGPKLLFYTSYNSLEETAASFLSGADSFVFKGVESVTFLDAVRATVAGERIWLVGTIPRESTERLQEMLATARLTNREQEVLGFMLQRLTNAEIGRELTIEIATVKSHVSSILGKLGLSSRNELF